MHSYIQACRFQCCLMEYGYVNLYPPQASDNAILRNEIAPHSTIRVAQNTDFFRISVSEGSFGSLHHSPVARNLLSIFMVSDVQPGVQDDFFGKKLPPKLKELRELVTKLTDLYVLRGWSESDAVDAIRNHTFFLSYGLLYLLGRGGLTSNEWMSRLHSFAMVESADSDLCHKLKLTVRGKAGTVGGSRSTNPIYGMRQY